MATPVYLSPISLIVQYLTNIGVLAAGGTLNTYVAGTVSTPLATFNDNTGTVLNPNPMTLPSSARPAAASGAPTAFWTPAGVVAKLVVTDVNGNQLVYLDNLPAINDPTGGLGASLANPATGFGADLVANAVKSYDVAASVRAANVPALASGQTLIIETEGSLAIGDGLGGAFYWSSSSSATDDGISVIKPNSTGGAGRYLRIVLPNTFPQNLQNINYTFALGDAGRQVAHNDANPYQYSIPANASVPFLIGTEIEVVNVGTGLITVVGAGPPTLYSYSNAGTGPTTVPAYQSVRLMKVGTDLWLALDPTAINYAVGTFTATLTGCTAGVTGSITYKLIGNRVTLSLTGAAITGTSNANSFTFTGLPAAIQPTAQRNCTCLLEDNTLITGGWGMANASGTVTFGLTFANTAAGFTASGVKGLPLGWQLVYDL